MKVTADDIAQLLASSPPRRVPEHVIKAARGTRSSWSTALFGLFFGSFGMIFVGVFFPWRLADEWRLAASGKPAAGEVVAVSDTNMSVNRQRVAEYNFTYVPAEGPPLTAACFATQGRWSVGEHVTVNYMPGHPELASIDGGRLNKAGTFGSFTILFPLVGYGMVAWFVRQRRQMGSLLRSGVTGEVNVLTVQATSTRVNGQTVHAIELSGLGGGAPVKIKRLNPREIDLAEERVGTKQTVFVLYDPQKPSRLIFPEALIDQ